MQDNVIQELFSQEINYLSKDDRFMRIKSAIHKNKISATDAAKLYGVSKSGYFNWLKRTGGQIMPKQKYKDLDGLVEEIFYKHNGNYGRPRIKIELENKYGWLIDERTVGASLKRLGLKASNGKDTRRKEYKNTDFSESDKIRRIWKGEYFGQKLYTDVSQFNAFTKKKNGGYNKVPMYFSAVIDSWSHEIIDFSISDNKIGFGFVYENISSAMEKVNKIKDKYQYTIIHSDHGTDYTTKEYYKLSKKYNFIKSMSRSGVTHDNIMIEKLFKVIKGEFWKKLSKDEKTPDGLEKGLEEYIDYYNKERIYVELRCSPTEYRMKMKDSNYENLCKSGIDKKIKEVFLGGMLDLPDYKTPQKRKFIKEEMK